MYEIEKGVPLPSKEFPLADMEIGDSFFVPVSDARDKLKKECRVRNIIPEYKKQGRKFTVRTVAGGFRCWRIE